MAGGRFQPATRKKSRLRMALDGPSGSGKTFTALEFAYALAQSLGPTHKGPLVAVIDSEHGSASKYAGDAPNGTQWAFDSLELHTYSPSEYASAIEDAGRAGYGVLVVDSLSHAWEGKDGALEIKDKVGGANKWAGWKDVTPMHRRMIEAILTSPCHVICTMRSKTDWVLETNENGKQVPRRVGTAPVQRAGMEYEFDIYGSLDWSHILTIHKSRCRTVDGLIAAKPTGAVMQPVIEWLNSGTDAGTPPPPTRRRTTDDQLRTIVKLVADLELDMEKEKKDLVKRYSVTEFGDLTQEQAAEQITRLVARLGKKKPKAETVAAAPSPAATPASSPAPDANGAAPAHPHTMLTPTIPVSTLPIRDDQLDAIGIYYGDLTEKGLMTPEQWRGEILKPYIVDTARNLTVSQADALIAHLVKLATESDVRPAPAMLPEKGGQADAASKSESETLQHALAAESSK